MKSTPARKKQSKSGTPRRSEDSPQAIDTMDPELLELPSKFARAAAKEGVTVIELLERVSKQPT